MLHDESIDNYDVDTQQHETEKARLYTVYTQELRYLITNIFEKHIPIIKKLIVRAFLL